MDDVKKYTTLSGCPIKDPEAILRIPTTKIPNTNIIDHVRGNLLIRDINLLETISHATHERIPERLVHAKGAGAHGVFTVTSDEILKYTSANFLSKVGNTTLLSARFSTVAGGRGSADTVRDSHGFAFKLRTDEGNLDWVFFSEPVFPIRDGGKFPSFVHCQKGVPKNNIFDSSTFWEFFNANSEAYHSLLMVFSDRGTPQGYQHSKIFSLHTYKFTKGTSTYYVKIHMKPSRGVKTFTRVEAAKRAGEDPDYMSRSLYQAIEEGKASKDFPSWEVFAQVVDPTLPGVPIDIFDPTRVLSHKIFKPFSFGTITLNDNPDNYFQEVEQISFSPTAIVPGWDVTPDPILQTRLFAYGSAARYRLGINFMQSTINKPKHSWNPTRRDGAGVIDNLKDLPNYIPGAQEDKITKTTNYEANAHEHWEGSVISFDSGVTVDDYKQPGEFWRTTLKVSKQQDTLVGNVAASLSKARLEIRMKSYGIFTQIDEDLGKRIKEKTEEMVVAPTTHKVVSNFLL